MADTATTDEIAPLVQRMAQFTGKQHVAAQAIAEGVQLKEAAARAGVTERTLRNWRQLGEYRLLISEYQYLERFELQAQASGLIRHALQVIMMALAGQLKPATQLVKGRVVVDPADAFAKDKQYDAAKMLVQAVVPSADAQLISQGLASAGTGTAGAAVIENTMRKLFGELAEDVEEEAATNAAAAKAVIDARDREMAGWDQELDRDSIIGLGGDGDDA